VLLVLIGLAAGFFSALFGVGGGIIIVPLLLVFAHFLQRPAMATSLAAIGLIAVAGTISYGFHGELKPGAAAIVGIPGAIGAIAGTALQQRLANRTLSLSSSDYELPALFAGGASWPLLQGVQNVTLHGLYQSNSFGVDEFRFGAEYGYHKDYFARVGYKFTSNDNELFGLTYGLGLRVPVGSSSMYVDYAGQHVKDFFDDVQHIGIQMTF